MGSSIIRTGKYFYCNTFINQDNEKGHKNWFCRICVACLSVDTKGEILDVMTPLAVIVEIPS